jgi:hypothetical protein
MGAGSWWSVVGLCLDIIGAFLVAVEAIKLENLRKLAETVRLRVAIPLQSPMFPPEDPESDVWQIPPTELAAMGFGHRKGLYFATHFVAGFILLASLCWILEAVFPDLLGLHIVVAAGSWIGSLHVAVIIVVCLFGGLLLLWLVVAGVWAAGEFVIHIILAGSAKAITKALLLIDAHTPRGTTGSVGFGILMCGFLGQIVGVFLNA